MESKFIFLDILSQRPLKQSPVRFSIGTDHRLHYENKEITHTTITYRHWGDIDSHYYNLSKEKFIDLFKRKSRNKKYSHTITWKEKGWFSTLRNFFVPKYSNRYMVIDYLNKKCKCGFWSGPFYDGFMETEKEDPFEKCEKRLDKLINNLE